MNSNLTITDKLIQLAWQQWSALGVAGTNACDTVAIDLEALLLLTGVVSDSDPRLHDEALDWCSECGHLISRPRLKQLLTAATSETRDAFAQPSRCPLDRCHSSHSVTHGIGSTFHRSAGDVSLTQL